MESFLEFRGGGGAFLEVRFGSGGDVRPRRVGTRDFPVAGGECGVAVTDGGSGVRQIEVFLGGAAN